MSDWLVEKEIEGATLCIVLGAISDEQIHQLRDRYQIFWLTDMASAGEWVNASSGPSIFPIDAANPEQLNDPLHDFLRKDLQHMPSLFVSASITGPHSQIYELYLPLVIQIIDEINALRTGWELQAFDVQENLSRNLPFLLKNRLGDDFRDAQKGPIFVVGSGPSLDETLPKALSLPRDKTLFIAADSALKAFQKLNAEPDFLVTLDPYKPIQHCALNRTEKTILLASSDCHQSWLKNFSRDKICIFDKGEQTDQWLHKQGLAPTPFSGLNNAGLTALIAGFVFGGDPIILLGMDLASSEGNRYGFLTQRDLGTTASFQNHEVPGNYEKAVSTPFLSDWKHTCSICNEMGQSRTLLNFNDRGAKLDKAELISIEDFSKIQAIFEKAETIDSRFKPIFPKDETIDPLLQKLFSLSDALSLLLKNWNSDALEKLFDNEDLVEFLGSYTFDLMRKISAQKTFNLPEYPAIGKELQKLRITWDNQLLGIVSNPARLESIV